MIATPTCSVPWIGRGDHRSRNGTDALVAEHHQGHRRVLALPALADVRTASFLTHGVQPEVAGERLQPRVAPPGRDLQPGRLRPLTPARGGRGFG